MYQKESISGDLGEIKSDQNGRAKFKFSKNSIPVIFVVFSQKKDLISINSQVWDIIGRSICVQENRENGKTDENRIACGIIARAAGIFQNYKKICACDGVTLWDERDVPLAGAKRKGNE